MDPDRPERSSTVQPESGRPDHADELDRALAGVPLDALMPKDSPVERVVPQYPDFSRTALKAGLAGLGVRVRWNVRSQHVEITAGGTPWARLTDRDEYWLRNELAERCRKRTARAGKGVPFRFSAEKWRVALGAILRDTEADPFMDYLNALSERDRTPRMRTLLMQLLGAEDTPAEPLGERVPVLRAGAPHLRAGREARPNARTCRPAGRRKIAPAFRDPAGRRTPAVFQRFARLGRPDEGTRRGAPGAGDRRSRGAWPARHGRTWNH